MRLHALVLAALLPALSCSPASHVLSRDARRSSSHLEDLQADPQVRGFRAVARYLGGRGAPIGARFVHERTGFVFDYLRVDSAPQGFLWVNAYPTSDRGEPHTQEHLLIGKGNRGRRLGGVGTMALARSSAFTEQDRTCYHFHTLAGADAFWSVFESHLVALLDPDYTDEEIRREVAHLGVSRGPDGTLRLEEKGTVYNEVVRSYERPEMLLQRAADRLLWGPQHPLALSVAGWPEAVRTLEPEDIRRFHREHYFLGNMGMIGAFPEGMPLDEVLERTGAILERYAGRTAEPRTADDLPRAAGASAPAVEIVDYPFADASAAGTLMLVWPPTRRLDLAERTLLDLFLSAVANGPGTNLYGTFVDRTTRSIDVAATGVASAVSRAPGQPVYVSLSGVPAGALSPERIAAVRAAVHDELARIAGLPADDPELRALGERMRTRLVASRRGLARALNSPPGFGMRGTGSSWLAFLRDLEPLPGFDRSLLLEPTVQRVEAVLAEGGNPWAARLETWGLLELPHALAARPSPSLRRQLDDARSTRLAAARARLVEQYAAADEQEALRRFAADYDATSAALDAAAAQADLPPFVASPPMTHDDGLRYDVEDVDGVPLVATRFDGMTASTVGIAFRLDGVPTSRLLYLALFPSLMRQAGLDENGVVTSNEALSDALRREILSLGMSYSGNPRTGRLELEVVAAGNDLAETRRALEWMARVLAHPDWRPANLPRLRDLVDQAIARYRRVMLGAEEGWSGVLPLVYWRQSWPAFAHTQSFLTQLHDLHRLRWMLADPQNPAVTRAVASALRRAAPAGRTLDRARLAKLAQSLGAAASEPDASLAPYLMSNAANRPPAARELLTGAGSDLETLLSDIPDAALRADWGYLCEQMARDLEAGAPAALAGLEEVRRAVFTAGSARAWLVGSTADGEALREDLAQRVRGFARATPPRVSHAPTRFIDERLRSRDAGAKSPRFFGFVNPNTSGGSLVLAAPGPSYASRSEDELLDYLAANLFTGGGEHSLFMRTWAAGLAYSSGVGSSLLTGRIAYTADRSPELPQTVRFAIDELRRAEPDPALVDYALSVAFDSRIASSYDARARSIASDLADGVTPDVVRSLRTRLLELGRRAEIAEELFRRLPGVYGRVLPGYAAAERAQVTDAAYFALGPDAQLDAWQRYLTGALGADAVLYRLYPRDFWITGSAGP